MIQMTPLFPDASQEVIFWVVFFAGILVGSIIENIGATQSKRSQKKAADKNTYPA